MKSLIGRMNVIVLNCIIVLLAVGLVFTGYKASVSLGEERTGFIEKDTFMWNIENNKWVQLSDFYYANMGYADTREKELSEIYGVAKYFLAATYHDIYEKNGDEERAHKYKMMQEQAQQEMGQLQDLCGEINLRFGIKE